MSVEKLNIQGSGCMKAWTNLQHGMDTKRHGWRPIDIGQEVGHAGDDAGGGLRSNLLKDADEDGQAATGQRLGGLQRGVGATTVPVDVIPDVGITNDRKNLRHCRQTAFLLKI